MPFKVKVADIPPEGVEIPVDLSEAEGQTRLDSLEGESIRLSGPLTGGLRVEPTGKRIVVRGRVRMVVKADCARCLESFDFPVDEEVFVVFSPYQEDEREEEQEAESLNQEVFTGESIDLWPVVQEHLVMGVPIRMLCRDDCQGLCPVCGRNKNTGQCDCRSQTGHSGLAGLAALKDKLPK